MSAALEQSPETKPAEVTEGQPKRRLRLGERLVKAGYVSEEQVDRALAVQKMGGGRLGSVLVNLKFCTEAHIRQVLAEQLGVQVVQLANFAPDPQVLELLPTRMVRKYEVVPIRMEGETLWVAMMDPYNLTAIDDIRFATGCKKLMIVTCTEDDFRQFLDDNLQTQCLIEEILKGGEFYNRAIESLSSVEVHAPTSDDEEDDEVIHDLTLAGSQAPIITLCNFLLVEAIKRRASDIHVEPYENHFRVRMRTDGRLHTILTPPQRLHGPMICRFKILAEMDISTRRIPQDGHIAIQYQQETVHYRVSTIPTVYGEKCVIRLLKKDNVLMSLDKIGFEPHELALLKRTVRRPQGLILVTGPTGSGKTTTLHASLQEINDAEVNIVTLEDPVEASIVGINHVKVNNTGGVTFESGLKSILRQDPDVVFIGEMRDPAVSAIAVKAALTGHLVMSTLHTNSAAESLTRLADMGVPPYLLASSLLMVIAQRLVRRVCPVCARPHKATEEQIKEHDLTPEQLESATLRRGQGCGACMDTGFRGRLAVYEILNVNAAMRDLIRVQAPARDILELARAEVGTLLLNEAALKKALAGDTTLDEVSRVCPKLM